MSKFIIYEWRCTDASCNTKFDEMAKPDVQTSICPECGSVANRAVSMGRIDPKLGADPEGFPTMADKWARKIEAKTREAERRQREHGDEI